VKDIVSIPRLSRDDVEKIYAKADEYKSQLERNEKCDDLAGKTLCIILEKPSLRTLVSYQVAMTQLGGGTIVLRAFPESANPDIHRKESDYDTVKILSDYVDAIVVRTFEQSKLEKLAEWASVPVINGLTNGLHPVKILADLYAMEKLLGRPVQGTNMVYVGDGGWNTSQSLLLGCAKLGVNITMACPPKDKYRPAPELMKLALADAAESGSRIEVVTDPRGAVRDADAIYTDTWIPMGREEEREERLQDFEGYQINSELLSHATGDPLIMHPLPRTPIEMTDEVAYSSRSVGFDQAALKLHVEKAILSLLMG
jgi:ornithine carbamoyltransferase